jgi:hypothetical protein
VLDTQSNFSIVAKSLIETSNLWSSSLPTPIEDSLGNHYTQIGTVKLTWFRPGRPTTFVVDFAVVEEDLDIMILGKQACEDSEIRKELQLYPFGLAPGGGKTKLEKEDEAQKKKEKEEAAQSRREEQAGAQAASDQAKRNREQQASQGGQPQSQGSPPRGVYGQLQSELRSQQSAYIHSSSVQNSHAHQHGSYGRLTEGQRG